MKHKSITPFTKPVRISGPFVSKAMATGRWYKGSEVIVSTASLMFLMVSPWYWQTHGGRQKINSWLSERSKYTQEYCNQEKLYTEACTVGAVRTSCEPCEKFRRAIFIPALIISCSLWIDRDAGPERESSTRHFTLNWAETLFNYFWFKNPVFAAILMFYWHFTSQKIMWLMNHWWK